MVFADEKITKEQFERINRKKNFYNCDEGKKELFNLMLDCKMFQPISEKDVPLRNYGLQKLTELGFNQEDKIRDLINYMLNLPAVLDFEYKEQTSNGND